MIPGGPTKAELPPAKPGKPKCRSAGGQRRSFPVRPVRPGFLCGSKDRKEELRLRRAAGQYADLQALSLKLLCSGFCRVYADRLPSAPGLCGGLPLKSKDSSLPRRELSFFAFCERGRRSMNAFKLRSNSFPRRRGFKGPLKRRSAAARLQRAFTPFPRRGIGRPFCPVPRRRDGSGPSRTSGQGRTKADRAARKS